jgi:hypothetical protein
MQKEVRHYLPNLFLFYLSTPKGIRIPVASVKGRCPRPLDDEGAFQTFINVRDIPLNVNT